MTDLVSLGGEIGVSDRTLRRAVNMGTLRGGRRGGAISLPLSERQYVRRSWPLIAALRGALRTEHNVRLAILFGSIAAGTDTTDSDVDVLVEMRERTLERVVDLEAKLSELLDRRVDLVLLHEAERDPALLADVLTEGRILLDRDRDLPRLRAQLPTLRRLGSQATKRNLRLGLEGIDRLMRR